MPLNRSLIYPPHSTIDLIIKLKSGFYDVDTEIIRESYRVVTPPVTDIKSYGFYIARECEKFPTYRLEKITSRGKMSLKSFESVSNRLILIFFQFSDVILTLKA